MDAFYASIEQRDNPSLVGVPVAVGQADGRGVVAAASYEARRYGVRSAMSSSKARRMCPDLRFVECRFDYYKEVSAQIHDIFREYTDIIEPISLDEAFLDVTTNYAGMELARDIAKDIKLKIREQLGLVASAGISYNKFLAKIASDYRKPDGLCVIPPERAVEFIGKMPVECFWGVGPVTAAKMHSLGIYTGEDLREMTLGELRLHFGKSGSQYYQFARGIDNRPVDASRIRKSCGVERTFEDDLCLSADIDNALVSVAHELEARLRRKKFEGSILTLKVRFSNFTQITRCVSGLEVEMSAEALLPAARELMEKADLKGRPIRLLGLSVGRPDVQSVATGQLEFDFDE